MHESHNTGPERNYQAREKYGARDERMVREGKAENEHQCAKSAVKR